MQSRLVKIENKWLNPANIAFIAENDVHFVGGGVLYLKDDEAQILKDYLDKTAVSLPVKDIEDDQTDTLVPPLTFG